MVKFLPHESVANGSFNLGHNTVLPQIKVWEDHLGNTEEVLTLLVSRLESDYAALNPKMRRPYQSKDVEPSHCLFHSWIRHNDSVMLHSVLRPARTTTA